MSTGTDGSHGSALKSTTTKSITGKLGFTSVGFSNRMEFVLYKYL